MLTDLNFLQPGKQWPPDDPETRERLATYKANRLIFKGEHARIYAQQFERVERVISNFKNIISYPVILNYQKLMSLKTADLLFGEEPRIGPSDKENKKAGEIIDKIKERSDLNNTGYMVTIDISRFGDGLLYIYNDGEGGRIDITTPAVWFPVVDETNLKRRKYEVLAWVINKTVTSGGKTYNEPEFLKVRIFDKTTQYDRKYKLISNIANNQLIIGDAQGTETRTAHGLKTFPIIQVPNVITSEDVTGADDYQDVDSILAELMVRVSQISRILDKHAAPSVSGPQTSLEQDKETGEWRLKLGNYFPRNTNDEPKPEYMTWDGKLDPAFKQAELLINQLYIISEMGAALLGDFSNTNSGQVPSGTAMRRMMMSPLAKVNRIKMRFDPALKKAIALASQLTNGQKLEPEDITINWQDGLPADPKEQADIEAVRTGGKATSSQQSAIMRLDDADEDTAMDEYERILTDEEPATQP